MTTIFQRQLVLAIMFAVQTLGTVSSPAVAGNTGVLASSNCLLRKTIRYLRQVGAVCFNGCIVDRAVYCLVLVSCDLNKAHVQPN
jgi:hypothetical protein